MIAMSLAIVGSLGLISGLVIGFYLGLTVPGGMIAMSLAIVGSLPKCRFCYWILPWIDSARRHDRHELGDQQILQVSFIVFYLGSPVPGGMIAMSLVISRLSA